MRIDWWKGPGARVLVCRYPAWCDELTGALRNGLDLGAVPRFGKSEFCLTDMRAGLLPGVLVVNLDADAAPMEGWFPNAQTELKAFLPNRAALKPLEWVERREAWNWKVSRGNVSGPLVVDPACGVKWEHSAMHLQREMRAALDG
jgi:carnitine monooxygenase subunit